MSLAYLIRRLLQAIAVIVGVSVIVFVMVHLLPGGPARAILGPQATPIQVKDFIVANGYNKPLFVQYVNYLLQLLHGNLGYSYTQNAPVRTLIGQALPKTALLVALAYGFSVIIGVPLGIWQAAHRDSALDHSLTSIELTGYSMPLFWLGLLLIDGLAVALHLFPPQGPQGATISASFSDPVALVLPVLSLVITVFGSFARFARSAALDSLAQDYIRTARAKGLSRRQVLTRHVLRNSILPLISLIGLILPLVIAGALVVEQVFNYPGMGLLFWNAAISRDYPVVMGVALVVAVATVLGSLVADILYRLADPRVSY
ncbi:MAG: ABC transporter permease [Ferrimicrobium sp.]|jgi:peptide/nickel transport system permease protein|uniref:ABC transporter permease n=1 Tax=Ferrimicrobium acidiphilum TaxID=121039 RepID=A0ABV3Y4H6_9ACTN|nr:ABC transporter permease [Ferrimicrobium sp.]